MKNFDKDLEVLKNEMKKLSPKAQKTFEKLLNLAKTTSQFAETINEDDN